MRQYADVNPTIVDSIIRTAESNLQRHYEQQQKELDARERVAESDHTIRSRGQIFAFIIAMTGLIGGTVVASVSPTLGGAFVAAVIGGGALLALMVPFLRTTRDEPTPTTKKDEARA